MSAVLKVLSTPQSIPHKAFQFIVYDWIAERVGIINIQSCYHIVVPIMDIYVRVNSQRAVPGK